MKDSGKLFFAASLLGASLFAAAPLRAADFTLENDQVSVSCVTKGGQLLPGTLRDKKTGETVKLGGELFSLVLTNGGYVHAGEFQARRQTARRAAAGECLARRGGRSSCRARNWSRI